MEKFSKKLETDVLLVMRKDVRNIDAKFFALSAAKRDDNHFKLYCARISSINCKHVYNFNIAFLHLSCADVSRILRPVVYKYLSKIDKTSLNMHVILKCKKSYRTFLGE